MWRYIKYAFVSLLDLSYHVLSVIAITACSYHDLQNVCICNLLDLSYYALCVIYVIYMSQCICLLLWIVLVYHSMICVCSYIYVHRDLHAAMFAFVNRFDLSHYILWVRLYDLDILCWDPTRKRHVRYKITLYSILKEICIYDCQINEESVCIDRFKTKLINRLGWKLYNG